MVVLMRNKFCIMEQKSFLDLGEISEDRFRKDFNRRSKMISEGDGFGL